MLKLILFAVIFAFSFSGVNAQLKSELTKEKVLKVEEGTYQIIVSGSKHQRVFTTDMIDSFKIEESRKVDQDVTIEIDSFTKIFIPSLKKINSPNFEKLKTIVYE